MSLRSISIRRWDLRPKEYMKSMACTMAITWMCCAWRFSIPASRMNNGKIILGTVQFGLLYGINNVSGKPDEKKVFDILDHAFHQGISILDTADAYGNASDLIGSYHQSTGNSFIVNTKFRTDSGNTISQQLKDSL